MTKNLESNVCSFKDVIKESLKTCIPLLGDIYLHKTVNKIKNSKDKIILRCMESLFYLGKYTIYGTIGWTAYSSIK